MPGVLYPYAQIAPSRQRGSCGHTYIIIRDRRGLTELLIPVEGQCEGLVGGISEKVSPTSFFVPINEVLTLMLKQGEW